MGMKKSTADVEQVEVADRCGMIIERGDFYCL